MKVVWPSINLIIILILLQLFVLIITWVVFISACNLRLHLSTIFMRFVCIYWRKLWIFLFWHSSFRQKLNTCQVSKLDTWDMLKMSNPSVFNLIPQNCVVDTHVRANRAFGLPARVSHNMAMFKRQELHLSGINPSRRLTVLTGVCTLSGPSLSLCGPWFWNYLFDSLAPESIRGQGY